MLRYYSYLIAYGLVVLAVIYLMWVGFNKRKVSSRDEQEFLKEEEKTRRSNDREKAK